MSALLAILFKFIPAVIVFIVTMGIVDTEQLEGHPLFKGIIAFFTAISTLLLFDQLYSLATGEPSTISGIIQELRDDNSSTPISKANPKKWNPKIYRGERSYSVNTLHTVKDNYTGLIWQKEDDGVKRTWKDAVSYCDNLSLAGRSWRLPEQEELYYLGDVSKYDPAIDTDYFTVKSSFYWSNTAYENNSSSAWSVRFLNGDDFWYTTADTNYVLCVSGQ